jgi:hypothetical protein
VAVEDAGVEALETRDRVAVVPLVRDGREQTDDVLAQCLEVGGDQDVVEPTHRALRLHGIAHQPLEQRIVERGFHFEIRIAQAVLPARADLA